MFIGFAYILPITAAVKFSTNQGYGEAIDTAVLHALLQAAVVFGVAFVLYLLILAAMLFVG